MRSRNPLLFGIDLGCQGNRIQWAIVGIMTAALPILWIYMAFLSIDPKQSDPEYQAARARYLQAQEQCPGQIISSNETRTVWHCQMPDGTIEIISR